MKIKFHLKSTAFTLVEVLLAVFVLEVGLLAIATFYAGSVNIVRTARNETTATNLAAGLLDEKLAQNYDTLTVGDGTPLPYSTDPAFSQFTQKVDIIYINSDLVTNYTSDTSMKKITVTISWTQPNGNRSVQVSSVKAKH